MAKKRILIIEDDPAIRQGLVDAAKFAAFEVLEAGDGESGLRQAISADYDMLLLDLVLPHVDGLEILKELRKAKPTMPVIILTAKGSEEDRVRGLRLGADDYVVKPFSITELLERIKAVMRRSPERPTDLAAFNVPSGKIDLELGEIHYSDGSHQSFSEREQELLRYLAQNRGRVISREEILQRVWCLDPKHLQTRTIDMHIARLREKLVSKASESLELSEPVIETVRGKGYLLR